VKQLQRSRLSSCWRWGASPGSYGLRGWVKLAPDRGAGEALAAAKEWWIGAEAYRVREAKLHGATVVGSSRESRRASRRSR